MTATKKGKKLPLPGPAPRYTVGVLADTHIPDRVNELHPLLLPALQAAGVSHIFHAGDICSRRVLTQLAEVAPVLAVRGNRDWFIPNLPLVARIEIGGVPIALMHGHGGILRYLVDKARFMLHGYSLARYLKLLTRTVPGARVVVYGHTHYPESLWLDGKLLFNPGSASFGAPRKKDPSIGFLQIYEDGSIQTRSHALKGYRVEGRQWVERSAVRK